MTPDHDPLTGLSNALDDESATATGPMPAWLAEQLDLEHRRQSIALPKIERHLRNLHDGKITLDEFERCISATISHAHSRVEP